MSPIKVIFSDIDGTLVHYPDEETLKLSSLGTMSEDGATFLPTDGGDLLQTRALPPSSTGLVGYISERTLQLAAELRRRGVRLVLVTGARSTTLFQRLPYLPRADAYVTESGGRIFHDVGAESWTAAPVLEDLNWRSRHDAVVGVAGRWRPPEARQGELWYLYRRLVSDGWNCDTTGYTTSFRLSLKKSPGKIQEHLATVLKTMSPTLSYAYNLGSVDFMPATSGKAQAAQYLMAMYGQDSENSVSFGDDDNDLELAHTVSHTFVPDFSHDSLREAVVAEPERFTVASTGGFRGTEELLSLALQASPQWGTWGHGTALPAILFAGCLAMALLLLLRHQRHRR